jgi:arylsulfatase A-like enzyme
MAPREHGGIARLFAMAVAAGLLFGLLEAAETAVARQVPEIRPFDKVSLDVFWTTPLVHVVVNLLGASGLALLHVAGLPGALRLGPYAFAFIGTFAVLWYSGYLARTACILLALGVAVQVGRAWVKLGSPRLLTRTITALGAVVLTTGLFVRAADWWSASSHVIEGRTQESVRPNVLLVVMDTVRADRLSAYGSKHASTPALDRLAAQGTLFERAYASSSWTLPSHASMLTGLPAPLHGAESTKDVVRADRVQLQQVLAAQGYATAAFVSNNVFFVPERGFGTGFQVFNVYSPQILMARSAFGIQLTRPVRRFDVDLVPFRGASAINRELQGWLDSVGDRPFFAVLNYMDAHEPYDAGFGRPHLRIWDLRKRRSPDNNRELAAAYDRAVMALDAEIGRLVDWLSRRPGWERTLLLITSDHGEAIADGSFDHGFDLTLEQLQVPLIMRLPGRVPAGLRVSAPVSLVDLAATTQALIADDGQRLPGRPLSWWFDRKESGVESPVVHADLIEVSASKAPRRLHSVVSRGFQYIHEVTAGRDRLFDAASDIAGERDLSKDPRYAAELERLKTAVRVRLDSQSRPAALPENRDHR